MQGLNEYPKDQDMKEVLSFIRRRQRVFENEEIIRRDVRFKQLRPRRTKDVVVPQRPFSVRDMTRYQANEEAHRDSVDGRNVVGEGRRLDAVRHGIAISEYSLEAARATRWLARSYLNRRLNDIKALIKLWDEITYNPLDLALKEEDQYTAIKFDVEKLLYEHDDHDDHDDDDDDDDDDDMQESDDDDDMQESDDDDDMQESDDRRSTPGTEDAEPVAQIRKLKKRIDYIDNMCVANKNQPGLLETIKQAEMCIENWLSKAHLKRGQTKDEEQEEHDKYDVKIYTIAGRRTSDPVPGMPFSFEEDPLLQPTPDQYGPAEPSEMTARARMNINWDFFDQHEWSGLALWQPEGGYDPRRVNGMEVYGKVKYPKGYDRQRALGEPTEDLPDVFERLVDLYKPIPQPHPEQPQGIEHQEYLLVINAMKNAEVPATGNWDVLGWEREYSEDDMALWLKRVPTEKLSEIARLTIADYETQSKLNIDQPREPVRTQTPGGIACNIPNSLWCKLPPPVREIIKDMLASRKRVNLTWRRNDGYGVAGNERIGAAKERIGVWDGLPNGYVQVNNTGDVLPIREVFDENNPLKMNYALPIEIRRAESSLWPRWDDVRKEWLTPEGTMELSKVKAIGTVHGDLYQNERLYDIGEKGQVTLTKAGKRVWRGPPVGEKIKLEYIDKGLVKWVVNNTAGLPTFNDGEFTYDTPELKDHFVLENNTLVYNSLTAMFGDSDSGSDGPQALNPAAAPRGNLNSNGPQALNPAAAPRGNLNSNGPKALDPAADADDS